MSIFRLILTLFNWALTIGVAGGLVDLTIGMGKTARQSNQVGIISMRSLTHQLMSPDTTIREMKAKRLGKTG